MHLWSGDRCWLNVLAAVGVAFLSLSASVENLVNYLFPPGWAWIMGGTFIAACWAYEHFCYKEDLDA